MNNEIIAIHPIDKLDATVWLPGSKSYSNRALIIGAMLSQKVIFRNIVYNEDTNHLRNALEKCGVQFGLSEQNLTVQGGLDRLQSPRKSLSLGASGTGARLILGLACLIKGETTITGNQRLKERPFLPLVEGLAQLGAEVESQEKTGYLPICVRGGDLAGGKCEMPGDVSSQFFSSILLVAPYAKKDVTIHVIGTQTSRPYIDITLDIMKTFGVAVENRDYEEYFVPAGQSYQAIDYAVESDASSASYIMGLAAITGGKIKILNINPDSVQGDVKFCDVLALMGCTIKKGKDWITVQGPEHLEAIDIDMNSMPDTVQTLAVVASFAIGTTRICNVANLRLKETDRLAAICAELNRVGIEATELEDGLEIKGGRPHSALIKTYNDHRMAMAFAIMGARVVGITIENPDVVAKSFPGFWHHIARFGLCEERKPRDV